MIVRKSSVFPASRETVFEKLQHLETLRYIAKPYATFEPIGEAVSTWTVGSTSAYRFRLFGVIPYGTHKIHILRFGLRIICAGLDNDPEKIGKHMLEMLAKFRNEGIVE